MNIAGLARWAVAALCVVAASSAFAQVKWNLATSYSPSLYLTENMQTMANEVDAATQGKFKITLHSNASLFKLNEIKRAVQTGQVQAGEVLISVLENENPIFGVDSLPFLATSYADAYKLWQASKPAIERALDRQGIKLLFAAPWPAQGLYAKKAVNSMSDLKGLKWRAYNPATSKLGELVGAQPVTVATADLSQAIATGTIEAFLSATPVGVQLKFWESMSHYYSVDAWVPKNMVIVNKRAFDALDKPSQAALVKAAATAEQRVWKDAEAKSKEWLALHAKNGMNVLEPSDKLSADLDRVGRIMVAEWLRHAGPDGQAILDAYRTK